VNAVRVLFLSANPSTLSRLAIDEEQRAITQRLRSSGLADRLELRTEAAVRPEELPAALLRHRPRIVHISGHGSQSGELLLSTSDGDAAPVSTETLQDLFRILSRDILCVVLNACYSEAQATALAQVVPCAVGMTRAVRDSAAIAFVAGFYEALVLGESVKTAFALGRTATRLVDQASESSVPQLCARAGVDVDRLFLFAQTKEVEPPPPPPPPPPPSRVPTRRSMRLLLQAVLPVRADFDSFCADSFPAVWSRFGSSMDRVERETLLLSLVKTPLILASLREHAAEAVEQAIKEQPKLLQFE
jgi:hypothetical protein